MTVKEALYKIDEVKKIKDCFHKSTIHIDGNSDEFDIINEVHILLSDYLYFLEHIVYNHEIYYL